MSLDGLRAWIGVVERKLVMRTRVFLVLVALAVGGAGAAIYLAIDAQDKAVSESDLQAVREEVSGSTAGASPEVTQLEGEVQTLKGEVAVLRSEANSPGKGSGGTEQPSGGAESETGTSSGGAAVPTK
jgi:hypothetical protein